MGRMMTLVGVGVALAKAVGVTTLVSRISEGVTDRTGAEIAGPWGAVEDDSSGQRPGPTFPSL